jgi:hypothetical protein
LGSTSNFLLGNTFPILGNILYNSCEDCSFVTGDVGELI